MTSGENIILCLLYTKEYYGYELEKDIDQNLMRKWSEIGFSSIYNILNKLAKNEYIGFRYEKEYGAPRRKVYFILEKGKKKVQSELVRMLSVPKNVYYEFNIGLVWSVYLPDEKFKEALFEYKKHLLKKIKYTINDLPEHVQKEKTIALAFERSRILVEAEIKWLDKVIDTL